jgi:hypothetical protein
VVSHDAVHDPGSVVVVLAVVLGVEVFVRRTNSVIEGDGALDAARRMCPDPLAVARRNQGRSGPPADLT